MRFGDNSLRQRWLLTFSLLTWIHILNFYIWDYAISIWSDTNLLWNFWFSRRIRIYFDFLLFNLFRWKFKWFNYLSFFFFFAFLNLFIMLLLYWGICLLIFLWFYIKLNFLKLFIKQIFHRAFILILYFRFHFFF